MGYKSESKHKSNTTSGRQLNQFELSNPRNHLYKGAWGEMMRETDNVHKKELKVSSPTDPAELEADRVADKIMKFSEPKFSEEVLADAARRKTENQEASRNNKENSGLTERMDNPGSGKPLSKSEKTYFEPRFQADFSDVTIHTDDASAKTAEAINARAYTKGNNIVFAKGEYQPGSDEGKKLMAHELAHVVQGEKSINQKGKQKLKNKAQTEVIRVDKDIVWSNFTSLIDQSNKYLNSLERWEKKNLVAFLDLTFPKTELAATPAMLNDITKEAIGNLAAESLALFGEKMLELSVKYSSKMFKYVGALFTGVPGFIIGSVVEVLVGKFLDTGGNEVKVYSQMRTKIEDEVVLKINSIRNEYFSKNLDDYKDDLMKKNITQTELALLNENILKFTQFCQANIKDTENRNLYSRLASLWVLENAQDEEDARAGINEDKWEATIKDLQTKNVMRKGDMLENYPDIFLHQTRLFIKKAIGKPGELQIALISQNIKSMQAKIRNNRKNYISQSELSKEQDQLYKEYENKKIVFNRIEREKLIKLIKNYTHGNLDEHGIFLSALGSKKEIIDFAELSCSFDLKKTANSVYIDNWEIFIRVPGKFATYFEVDPDSMGLLDYN